MNSFCYWSSSEINLTLSARAEALACTCISKFRVRNNYLSSINIEWVWKMRVFDLEVNVLFW